MKYNNYHTNNNELNGIKQIPQNCDFNQVPARKVNQVPDHTEVLSQLLEVIQPVNFTELAGLTNSKQKLRIQHYAVHAIKQLLRIADQMDIGICEYNDHIYLFNGASWNTIEDKRFRQFLGRAAKEMGVDEQTADFHQNREHFLKQFKSDAYFPAPVRDKDKVLINLQNGTLEISGQQVRLKEFDRHDFLTYQLPFKYDPDAKAPKFQQYLDEVLPDIELQKVLAEYTGYIFVPNNALKLEKVMLLKGTGANGKSVFFEILQALLGRENLSAYSLQNLTDTKGYHRVNIADKLVNFSSEISGKNIESDYFKTLASGEPVDARSPNEKPLLIRDYARLIFNVNQLPVEVEHTDGFFRRFLIIPFEKYIPKAQRDPNLAQKIIDDELPGVLNWAIEGMKRLWLQKDFTDAEKANEAVEQYRKESDSVALFIEEENYVPSSEDLISQNTLYQEYKLFAEMNGYRPVASSKFGNRLENQGFERVRRSDGRKVYAHQVYNNNTNRTHFCQPWSHSMT